MLQMVVVLTYLFIYSFNHEAYTKRQCANSGDTKEKDPMSALRMGHMDKPVSTPRITNCHREEENEENGELPRHKKRRQVLLRTVRKSSKEEVML